MVPWDVTSVLLCKKYAKQSPIRSVYVSCRFPSTLCWLTNNDSFPSESLKIDYTDLSFFVSFLFGFMGIFLCSHIKNRQCVDKENLPQSSRFTCRESKGGCGSCYDLFFLWSQGIFLGNPFSSLAYQEFDVKFYTGQFLHCYQIFDHSLYYWRPRCFLVFFSRRIRV